MNEAGAGGGQRALTEEASVSIDAVLKEMHGYVANARRHMTSAFDELAESWQTSPVRDVVHYALDEPGKMIRPTITLAACQAVGGDPEMFGRVAAGIEYGHLASLMHDDLIDEDATRRRIPSVWNAFGVPSAVIAGDLLLFTAFHALACQQGVPAERIVRTFEAVTRSGVDACFGTSLEMALAGNISISTETYLKMAAGKTGAVLRGCSEGGAVIGGGSPRQIASLRDYGEDLGVAFQIIDDVLPYESDEETMGKPVVSDLRNRRPTLPVLLARDECTEDERDFLETVYSTGIGDGPAAEAAHHRMRAVLRRTGALAGAREMADEYCASALDSLAGLRDNAGVRLLRSLVHLARDRRA
uniref:Octaprenyl diphosphate synthase n=1 Tax=Streptomyces argenteolus TaxID=67274 RepID=A9ZNV2_9ACTN|nr:octaprenyl diphosphate synthase [Streptomyces argenteolus]